MGTSMRTVCVSGGEGWGGGQEIEPCKELKKEIKKISDLISMKVDRENLKVDKLYGRNIWTFLQNYIYFAVIDLQGRKWNKLSK